MQAVYDSIVLPQRATAGSAGYDFYVPAAVTFPKDASVLVPTGIRARMAEGWVLAIFPRSGLGFKHRIGLDNTVGIIDADYYGSSNEGHIMIKMSCTAHDAGHSATVAAGDGFAQGIFSALWDYRGRRRRRRAGRRIWFHHKEINHAQMAVCPRTRPVFLPKKRA